MPNWCENTITVEGNSKDVADFVEKISGKNYEGKIVDFRFSSLIPEPFSLENPDYDWYNWRMDNWGTKWDNDNPEDVHMDSFTGIASGVSYMFMTAWSPPIYFIHSVSKMFPELTFYISYGEMGMDFAGEMEFLNGATIKDNQGTYSEFYECDCCNCDENQ